MCKLFEIMEAAEKIYEGGNTSKNKPRTESNRVSNGRKRKGGESASTINPEMGRSGKCKTRNSVHLINRPTGGETCLCHGPMNSIKECKVLRYYSTKYTVHSPHNGREACSGGNKKRDKTVQFDGTTEEMKITTARDAPIPRK